MARVAVSNVPLSISVQSTDARQIGQIFNPSIFSYFLFSFKLKKGIILSLALVSTAVRMLPGSAPVLSQQLAQLFL